MNVIKHGQLMWAMYAMGITPLDDRGYPSYNGQCQKLINKAIEDGRLRKIGEGKYEIMTDEKAIA